MSTFPDALAARAGQVPRTVVFPEWDDPRIQDAVRMLERDRLVQPVRVEQLRSVARTQSVVDLLLARRADKGMTEQQAQAHAQSPLIFAHAMVALGEVHGCVAGAVYTTADVLRSALWTVGVAEGIRTVSSSFYMVVPAFRGPQDEVLTFTDAAVVPDPSSEQLVDIARAAAHDRRRIVGDEPVVALLSFSTKGSADTPSVLKVRNALQQLRAAEPTLQVDGELQADAALITDVASRKAPASLVAGRANVLVFPSLDAGNIAYKLVERLAHAHAIGPILQGLGGAVNDLSRGSAVQDIIDVALITALQSQGGMAS
jgi:phosphate acetyltransferase